MTSYDQHFMNSNYSLVTYDAVGDDSVGRYLGCRKAERWR